MDIVQLARVIVFGFLTQLPIILTMWSLTILPEILELNYGIEKPGERTIIAGYYYTTFFYGLILGSFIWPHALNYISKRNALFLGIVVQCVLCAVMGLRTNVHYLYAIRFACGLMHNINTVGKDFIFEFCDETYRQYAFSFKSCFGILAGFGGPFLGFYMYLYTGKSFSQTSILIAGIYLISILMFIVFFYLIKADLNATRSVSSYDDEEKQKLKTGEVKKQIGLVDTLKYCITHAELRAYMLVYFITNGVFKTINSITVFYLEAPFMEEGLGVNSKLLTYISLMSYVPCVIVLLSAPLYVPQKINYRHYIMGILTIFSTSVILLPAFKDILTQQNYSKYIWFVYLNQIILYSTNPKLFSPTINYLVGKSVKRRMRASANAVTFIGSTLTSAIMLNLIAPLYSFSIENEYFLQYNPYSKYSAFAVLTILLYICIYLLKNRKHSN